MRRSLTAALVSIVTLVTVTALAAGEAAQPQTASAPTKKCQPTMPNGSGPSGERRTPWSHGNGALWTQLPRRGLLVAVPNGTARGEEIQAGVGPDGSVGIKFPWWGARSAGKDLLITGARLDGPARPLRASVYRGGSRGGRRFWSSGISFPSAGCWRVTARAGTERLTFTLVFVDRVTDPSPPVRPAPAARGCPATTPNGQTPPGELPSPSHHGNGEMWTELRPRGMLVAIPPGRRMTAENTVDHRTTGAIREDLPWWTTPAIWHGRRSITGRRLDGPSNPPLRATVQQYRPELPDSSQITFPRAGCWEVTARVGRATLTVVIYVVDERGGRR